MPRNTKEKSEKLDEKMFGIMRKTGFNQSEAVARFKKWSKRHGYSISTTHIYRIYDRVLEKCEVTMPFQQTVQSYYNNLNAIQNMVTQDALATGDITDWQAVMRLVQDSLGGNGRGGGNLNLFQLNQQNNNNIGASADELLSRLKDNLERLGPTVQRFGELGSPVFGGPPGAVHPAPQAKLLPPGSGEGDMDSGGKPKR